MHWSALYLMLFSWLGVLGGPDVAWKDKPNTFRIMTFNIRYPNPGDGPNYWPNRKEMVASMVRFHGADLVGVQEAFRSQLDELSEQLPGYAWTGV